MPFESYWYVENRVLWMKLSGVITQEELRDGNAEIAEMVADVPDGLILVRDARDLNEMRVPAATIARVASWFRNGKFLAMILMSSADSMHLEITGEFMARLKNVPTEGAFNVAEAHQRLVEIDPSLADSLPALNA